MGLAPASATQPNQQIGGRPAGTIKLPFKETKLEFNASRRSDEGCKPYWKRPMRARCFAATISEVDATISAVDSATNRRMRHTQNDKVAMRVPMNRYKKYRQNAADCFAVAQQLSDLGLKASMLEMAQSWLMLADHVEQSGATIAKLAICRFRRGSNGANSQRARRSYRSGEPKLESPKACPRGSPDG